MVIAVRANGKTNVQADEDWSQRAPDVHCGELFETWLAGKDAKTVQVTSEVGGKHPCRSFYRTLTCLRRVTQVT